MKKIPLIVVAGPTASGKTSLAIEIAKSFNGEIVSADSMQIYKYMDIGTAKPTKTELEQCKHHLIDFVMPDELFSVADYTRLAHSVITDITERGKLPVMCGGTGLYIDSVVNDIAFGDVKNDYELREQLKQLADAEGGGRLIDILAEFDPVSANRLHPNNIKRIIRAIEFYKVTGVPISEHQEMTKQTESRYNPIIFMINYPREVLYDRINARVDMMISNGLPDEVQKLLDMGYSKKLNSMQGIGYKELIPYLEGECTISETINAIKQNSRRYAKRQLTWFLRNKNIICLEPDNAAKEAIKNIAMR